MVLGIASNGETISRIQEDVQRLYANTTPFDMSTGGRGPATSLE
jgi:hypothetical protein